MNLASKQFLKYTFLPGLRPRITELFFSGFQYVPFFIALVYQAVRLLPAAHPYANPANIGRFGLRHVIAEAAANIVLDKKNLDQILLFVLILAGVVIVGLQIVLLGLSVLSQPVLAATVAMPTTFAGFFITQKPAQDIAHIFLDMIFGVPDMFKSCIDPSVNTPCKDIHGKDAVLNLRGLQWPWPAHQGLHSMFLLYSTGLLIIAVLITSYFIATVLLETAQTGTAFGKRFNKVWAPVRLVVAFGLLVPLGTGLNSSQYLVLYAAKLGSGFATNGWNLFNAQLNESMLLDKKNLVSTPNVPEVGGLLQFMYVARTCAEMAEIDPKFAEQREFLQNYTTGSNKSLVRPYFVRDSLTVSSYHEIPLESNGTKNYDDMMKFADGDKQVTLRFGIVDEGKASANKGKVDPVCGELNIPLTDMRQPSEAEKGTEAMQRYYLFLIEELWFDVYKGSPPDGYGEISAYTQNFPKYTADYFYGNGVPKDFDPPDNGYRNALQKFYNQDLNAALNDPDSKGLTGIIKTSEGAVREMIKSTNWDMTVALKEKGWAGAGIWYNRIADLNGAVTAAVLGIPTPNQYPKLMEEVRKQKRQKDQNIAVDTMFEPVLADGKTFDPSNYGDERGRRALWEAFKYWQDGGARSTHTTETSNTFVNAVNAVFGTDGLYSMRKNPDVHPLAQLVGLGRSLIEASIRNIGGAVGAAAGFGFIAFVSGAPIPLVPSMVSFIVSITIVTMTLGFILFYVLPFLPFIYFFFAVGNWVKAIFEAMIGMPLWALAHIRIDGDGLPGKAARNGYFLMFEIFLRPILIVFGLLASVSIFSALVSTLNQTWDLIVQNVGGFDVSSEINGTGPSVIRYFRSAIDEFFYTIIYTIIVYMMGMSTFKLIDQIPHHIIRWMGESIQSFRDQEDSSESLMGTATVGSQQVFSTIGGDKGLGGALTKISRGMR